MSKLRILIPKGRLFDSVSRLFLDAGYPIFLAVIMMIFGTESTGVLAVRVLQALVSTGTICIVYQLAVKLLNNRGAGLIVAFFIAFYPPLILYSRFILSETLYIFFITFYVLTQLNALDKREGSYHVGAGVLFAVSVLFRPIRMIPLPGLWINFIMLLTRHPY